MTSTRGGELGLLPCPFCGGEQIGCQMQMAPEMRPVEGTAQNYCEQCGATGPKTASMDDAMDAAWNRRAELSRAEGGWRGRWGVRFCKDCKFFSPSGYVLGYGAPSISWPARCSHPSRISMVYGHTESAKPDWARSVAGDCGPDAGLFEQAPPPTPKPPKRSLWQKLTGVMNG